MEIDKETHRKLLTLVIEWQAQAISIRGILNSENLSIEEQEAFKSEQYTYSECAKQLSEIIGVNLDET